MKELALEQTWSLPFCPTPPAWQLDWDYIQNTFGWVQAMRDVPQSPVYHAEGDVFIHTRMVVEALTSLPVWRELVAQERSLLFLATLLHDVGKPACTQIEADGRISSRGHARKGEQIARELLWTGRDFGTPLPFAEREYVARLVRLHGLPLQFLDKGDPTRAVIGASQSVRMDHLALLAEADVLGRICSDQQELLTRITLFREFCQEEQCYTAPRSFANDYSRFMYFHSENRDPNYAAYDETTFKVILLSGLPGVGKDTWLQENLADWPVISLDALRKELKIAPDASEGQGRVVQAAKERVREYLRQKQSFAWNATNITKTLRQPLVDLFTSYGARVHIVYLDAPFDTILKRNLARKAYVPEQIIYKMLYRLEVPDVTEAYTVEWITSVAPENLSQSG